MLRIASLYHVDISSLYTPATGSHGSALRRAPGDAQDASPGARASSRCWQPDRARASVLAALQDARRSSSWRMRCSRASASARKHAASSCAHTLCASACVWSSPPVPAVHTKSTSDMHWGDQPTRLMTCRFRVFSALMLSHPRRRELGSVATSQGGPRIGPVQESVTARRGISTAGPDQGYFES